MPLPTPLPDALLAEIGNMVVTWANIEQDIILHSSAMAAQSTDGFPKDHLRMDFRRLRTKWLSLVRAGFAFDLVQLAETLNDAMARFSLERGNIVHGLWTDLGENRFSLMYWEQRTSKDETTLARLSGEYTLATIREAVAAHRSLGLEIHHFCTGKHPSFKNKKGTIAKIR